MPADGASGSGRFSRMAFVEQHETGRDPLAEAVVAASVKHARTAELIAQVSGLALAATEAPVATAERLGIRWQNGRISSPDYVVLPAEAIDWDTTSYVVPGADAISEAI